MTSSVILIPPRYNSTRYPGKPLAMLDGVPMIKRVYDACIASKIPTYVLTDDMRIYAKTEYKSDWQFAYHYMMTHNGAGPRMGVHN